MIGLRHTSTQPNGTYVLLSFSLAINAINTAVFLRGSVEPFTYRSAVHLLPLSPQTTTTLLLSSSTTRSPKPSNLSSSQPLTHFHLLYINSIMITKPIHYSNSLFYQECFLLPHPTKRSSVSSITTKLLRQTFTPLPTALFFYS